MALEISTISSIITALSVLTGIIFAIMQLRHLNRVRKTEIIMKVYDKFSSKEMLAAISNVRTANFDNIKESLGKDGALDVRQIGLLFEEIGVLFEHNLIDIEMVDSFFGQPIISLWEKMLPVVNGLRDVIHEPDFLVHAENMIERLSAFRDQTH